MKLRVLAVHDKATASFGQPMFMASLGGAIRSFGDEVNRAAPDNMLHAHPEHFDLYELGLYDMDTGLFECHIPRPVAVGQEMKNARKSEVIPLRQEA